MKSAFTPREFAKAIGVSESSVKRWADSGEITAMRTAGGHRRISLQEAARYVRMRSIPVVRPEILGLSHLLDPNGDELGPRGTTERIFESLRCGADAAARGLLLSEYLRGGSLAEIVDGPFRTALAQIGELWSGESKGVFEEHRATQIAIEALGALRDLLNLPEDAPAAVGGAPSGDVYLLPSMAVATVLEGEGMRAVNLGADTPIESLAAGVEELNARLAWLSVSVADAPDVLRKQILGLLARLEASGTALVVGGSQVRRLRLPKSDLLYVGGSMVELEALVKGMMLSRSAGTVTR